jgi:hypothetical protein
VASNELVTPKVVLCPSDKQRVASDTFRAYGATNVSYDVGNDGNETRPSTIIAADRSLTGYEVPNQYEHTVCYLAGPGYYGKDAKWDPAVCHGGNAGNLVFSDGSAQQLNDVGVKEALRAVQKPETLDGTLRFFLPFP